MILTEKGQKKLEKVAEEKEDVMWDERRAKRPRRIIERQRWNTTSFFKDYFKKGYVMRETWITNNFKMDIRSLFNVCGCPKAENCYLI